MQYAWGVVNAKLGKHKRLRVRAWAKAHKVQATAPHMHGRGLGACLQNYLHDYVDERLHWAKRTLGGWLHNYAGSGIGCILMSTQA